MNRTVDDVSRITEDAARVPVIAMVGVGIQRGDFVLRLGHTVSDRR